MTSTTRIYHWMVAIALVGLSLVTPRYAHAALSHAIAPSFPDRAEHAAQHSPPLRRGDHHLTSNPNPTLRVGARDEGKAAAERRWVGASPDGEGRLAWAAAHGAYGAVIATAGPAEVEVEGGFVSGGPRVESPFRLLGQVNDPDADLCWTRFRCFDAETGTWISTDPLEINGGLNLYGLDGSPSDVVDPLGLMARKNHPPKSPSSPGSMQKEVERGQAPSEVDRVDRAHVPGQQPHVHFADGTSSNQDGTTHDAHRGTPNPSKKTREWLESHAWTPPPK